MKTKTDQIKVNIVAKESNEILETKTFSTVRQLERYENYFLSQCDTERFRLDTWTPEVKE